MAGKFSGRNIFMIMFLDEAHNGLGFGFHGGGIQQFFAGLVKKPCQGSCISVGIYMASEYQGEIIRNILAVFFNTIQQMVLI